MEWNNGMNGARSCTSSRRMQLEACLEGFRRDNFNDSYLY
jgi:hypothetical protein